MALRKIEMHHILLVPIYGGFTNPTWQNRSEYGARVKGLFMAQNKIGRNT